MSEQLRLEFDSVVATEIYEFERAPGEHTLIREARIERTENGCFSYSLVHRVTFASQNMRVGVTHEIPISGYETKTDAVNAARAEVERRISDSQHLKGETQ